MICFNFKKNKECEKPGIVSALQDIKYVISPYVRLDAQPEDCHIVEWGQEKNLHVALPPSSIGTAIIEEHDVSSVDSVSGVVWKGKINLPNCIYNRNFTIRDRVLYIGKAYNHKAQNIIDKM